MRSRDFILLALAVSLSACSSGNVPSPDASVVLDMSSAIQPTLIAPASTLTHCLAIDDTNAYWSDFGTGSPVIVKAPLGGGAASPLASGGDKYACVATDGAGAVYYTDSGKTTVMKASSTGTKMLASGQNVLGGLLAAANGSVYWVTDTYGGNADAYNGMNAIVSVASSGGSVNVIDAQLAAGAPGGLAVVGGTVYYSDGSGVFGRPLSMPMQSISFCQSTLHLNKLAVGSTNLAMTELVGVGSGDLAVFRLDGTGRTVLSSQPATPLAVDDSGVYADENGQLVLLALDGSSTKVVAGEPPLAVALSASTIYFLTSAGLYSVAK
jgi:hypothetical protein